MSGRGDTSSEPGPSPASPLFHRCLGVLALVAIAAHLAFARKAAVDRIASGLLNGLPGMGESALTARRRTFGSAVDQIEAIKRLLPPNSEYLLAGDNTNGALYFLAYDLAPRRVRRVGSGWPTESELRTLGAPLGAPPFVVVVPSSPLPPYVVKSRIFFAQARP